jgi:hexosaminidase
MASFYPLHYGPDVVRMDRAYQLLSHQARFWNESWETAPSQNRKPIVGNSYGIYPAPMSARDQQFSLPAVPSPADLAVSSDWVAGNKRLLDLVAQYRSLNDEVVGLLQENLRRAERNRYSLEVLLTIANICRENLDAIDGVAEVAHDFAAAQRAASRNRAPAAVAQLDRAMDAIARWKESRNRVLRETNEVWGKSWHLRVSEANNRRFLHEVDDVKDHLPDRTPDMSYLIYRELKLPVENWFNQILAARNAYATSHAIRSRTTKLNWSST